MAYLDRIEILPTHVHEFTVRWLADWAEARIKIARMTLTIKLDGNWSSFQLANSAPPLSVTDSAIAPSARMHLKLSSRATLNCTDLSVVFRELLLTPEEQATTQTTGSLL